MLSLSRPVLPSSCSGLSIPAVVVAGDQDTHSQHVLPSHALPGADPHGGPLGGRGRGGFAFHITGLWLRDTLGLLGGGWLIC